METLIKTICPHCNSKEVVRREFKRIQAHGIRQRYFCKSCSKRFIPRDPFFIT